MALERDDVGLLKARSRAVDVLESSKDRDLFDAMYGQTGRESCGYLVMDYEGVIGEVGLFVA